MGDFRKKIPRRMISGEKTSCKEIPGEKNPTQKKNIFDMAYNAGKNLTPLYVRKINYITRTRFLKGRLALIED